MRHPFDGINTPCDEDLVTSELRKDRRSVLTRLVAASAGFMMALLGRTASAQSNFDRHRRRPTTFAIGEEGGFPQSPPRRYPFPTTRRWGETGRVTTYAFGEEGGATTFATGEEGGATTYAVGEEGGGVTTYATGEEGGATTYAVGEEGGVPRYRPR